MKKRILVLGNPLLKEDSAALQLIPFLEGEFLEIEFVEFMPEDGLENEGRNPVILDIVKGIKKPTIIDNFEHLTSGKLFSPHDFGLAENLLLLKKMGKIDSFIVIGIPYGWDAEKALPKIIMLIRSISL